MQLYRPWESPVTAIMTQPFSTSASYTEADQQSGEKRESFRWSSKRFDCRTLVGGKGGWSGKGKGRVAHSHVSSNCLFNQQWLLTSLHSAASEWNAWVPVTAWADRNVYRLLCTKEWPAKKWTAFWWQQNGKFPITEKWSLSLLWNGQFLVQQISVHYISVCWLAVFFFSPITSLWSSYSDKCTHPL